MKSNAQDQPGACWQGQKVLITGGAGFIGSTLANRLVNLGARVTVMDSLVRNYGGNLFNLKECADRLQINFSDLRDPYSLEALLQDVDYVFNMAGQTSHMDSMHDPHTDLSINCKAQLNLLETLRRVSVDVRIVFVSTRQIYGRPQYLPVDEKHPVSPVDINGIHKYAAEQYHQLYHSLYGLRTTILRLTNTIGPRMRIKDARQTFVGVWIRNLIEQRPIEIWGGEQLRDFNDVDDVVEALLLAAGLEDCFGQVFNLGSKRHISLLDLGQLMIDIHGSGELRIKDYPKERAHIDIGDYYSDHQSFSSLTGWSPKTPLEQTLERTITYYRDNLHSYV